MGRSKYLSFGFESEEERAYRAEMYEKYYSQVDVEYNDCSLIFVYGTLQSGCGNNRLLVGSDLLGQAETVEKYSMSIGGSIPFVSVVAEETTIKGEVWKVADTNSLILIDNLESHPDWYQREKIKVKLNDEIVEAWIYFNEETFTDEMIKDGDYKRYISMGFSRTRY
jgi:gamma-glutamylcyclotransferase (GGCT)/AIG2-like uncharacterized protein YtfP